MTCALSAQSEPCSLTRHEPIRWLIFSWAARHPRRSSTYLQDGFHKDGQFDDSPFLQLYKAIVGQCFRRQMFHMLVHIFKVKVLGASITWIVKLDQNSHILGVRHITVTIIVMFIFAIAISYRILDTFVKNLAKHITHKNYFCNFAIRKRSGCF